ncbi:MAG: polysaccharide pyruvyl transferase family protein [Jiangellaceae bacterium]
MSRPVRRVGFYGYLGSGNIGNDATFETVLAWLGSAHPDVEARCITIAPAEMSARYGVPSVPLSWSPSAPSGNRVTGASGKLLGRLLDVPRSFALAGSVDAVVVPGMGVLEEKLGVRPWGLPLWLFLIAAACRLRRRPFVLLDVGAEWAANPVTRRLYVATVGLATHVSYRDGPSAAAMRRAGARAPEAVAPDLVFAHPAATLAEPESGLLVVGVMAYYGRGDDPVRGADVRRTYVAAMAEAMARFADAGDRVVLVGGDRVDIDVARDVRAAVLTARPTLPDDAVLVRDVATFTELTDEMMRADVVIASRFHNLICALRLARPTVSVGYAKKNRHLMQALGLDGYCQDIEHLDADRLVAQVQAARMDQGAFAARVHDATSDYASQVESLLDRVAGEALGLARTGTTARGGSTRQRP